MKKKWLLSFFLVFGFLFCGTYASAAEETIAGTKEIKSIEEPTWIFKAGINKGKNHDRQDLGFMLRENTVMKVRQTNPAFKHQLTVRLLSNDSKEEKTIKVGSEWVSVSATTVLVPFVDTPYGITDATLEYQIEDTRAQKPLPIYEEQGNQTDFFETWDTYDGNFALIKGKSFQLFVPKRDKEFIRSLKDFQSIDELIVYYEDIFKKYNEYIGLDNSTHENRESENRYFLKADKSGPGGAYYGTNWTANTSLSTDMWLKKGTWGTLHEIAHGYQASFDSKGMYTGEVSNNLFGVQYQYETYGKEADQTSWLFNFGKREEIDQALYQLILNDGKGYNELNDLRYQLVILTMIKQKAGKESFTKMYQEYRRLANLQDFNENDYTLPDLINKYYSETSGFDFSPVLEKLKLQVDPMQAELNRAKGYQPTAFLADVVPENQLAAARQLIDESILINSNFELVDNQVIAPLGLTGNVTVNLEMDEMQLLEGKKMQLKEGNTVVQEVSIKGNTNQFTAIPNGIYTIEIPNQVKNGYEVNQHYVYVKEAENNVTISMKKINAPAILSEKVQFLGLSDKLFATFETNLDDKQAIFTLNSESPHSYYKGEKYASIQVMDSNGSVVYSKEIEGTNNKTGSDVIPFEEGYKVVIFHDETKNRLKGSDAFIHADTKENTLTMTKFGLQNDDLNNHTESAFVAKIDQLASKINEFEELKNKEYSNQKSQLYAAIQYLNDPLKTEYLEKYKDLFIETEEQPTAHHYLFSLKGYSQRTFSEVEIDLSSNLVTLSTMTGRPYPLNISNINNTAQTSVLIKGSDGKLKHYKNYTLKTYYAASKEETTIVPGDFIVIKTPGFGDIGWQNLTTEESEIFYKEVAFKVTDMELQQVAMKDVPK